MEFCADIAWGRLVRQGSTTPKAQPYTQQSDEKVEITDHGASVHRVSSGVDEGKIIQQARVPVLPGDTVDALAARALAEEHKLYPAAVRQFLGNK